MPAQGHQAATCQLCRCAGEPDTSDCRKQPDKERLHCRPCTSHGRLL